MRREVTRRKYLHMSGLLRIACGTTRHHMFEKSSGKAWMNIASLTRGVSMRGTSPTVKGSLHTCVSEPSLTVGLMFRGLATHSYPGTWPQEACNYRTNQRIWALDFQPRPIRVLGRFEREGL